MEYMITQIKVHQTTSSWINIFPSMQLKIEDSFFLSTKFCRTHRCQNLNSLNIPANWRYQDSHLKFTLRNYKIKINLNYCNSNYTSVFFCDVCTRQVLLKKKKNNVIEWGNKNSKKKKRPICTSIHYQYTFISRTVMRYINQVKIFIGTSRKSGGFFLICSSLK